MGQAKSTQTDRMAAQGAVAVIAMLTPVPPAAIAPLNRLDAAAADTLINQAPQPQLPSDPDEC